MLSAIASLRGRRTVIFVTHRAEPLSLADVVVRLDGAPGFDPFTAGGPRERRRGSDLA
jgi:ABC-type transport system involved in cytochrome bd biosynthesis fused ATPase/permease subunit